MAFQDADPGSGLAFEHLGGGDPVNPGVKKGDLLMPIPLSNGPMGPAQAADGDGDFRVTRDEAGTVRNVYDQTADGAGMQVQRVADYLDLDAVDGTDIEIVDQEPIKRKRFKRFRDRGFSAY